MKRFRAICLPMFLALLALGAFAAPAESVTKYVVKGRAMDSIKNEPVPYVTAVLLGDDQKPIASAYSDDKGAFELKAPKGKYKITVTYVGYNPYEAQIEVNGNMDLGVVNVAEGIQIGAATVIGQLITTDLDKTTYNTSVDPETPSLTALEMMRKVPMLSVDGEDNLKLKGEGNFKILVNGKSSSLMSNNYKDVLKSMPAASIKNIEVITNPPAKYDAEGIGGIINIITVRKTNDGLTGSVGAGADSYGGFNANGYIAAAMGKFNISANVFGGQYRQPDNKNYSNRENYNSVASRYINSDASSSYVGFHSGLSLEASYEIDTFNLITLSVSGYLGGNDNNSDNFTTYLTPTMDTTLWFRNLSNGRGTYGSIEGSLDYQKTFKKPDQTLTASYKFEYNPEYSSYNSDVTGFNYNEYQRRSKNNAWGGEHAFQIDYFEPINDKHQVEVGLKYIMRPNVSNTLNEDFDPSAQQWIENLLLKNDLDYLQHIGSAYAAYQFKYKTFSVKAGLRAEYTVNTGQYKMYENGQPANSPIFNRYFNIVPYATIGFKPSDAEQLRFGYTQRLSRPGIWYLNPYVNNEDPMNVSTGNPDLESEISHTFDLSYGIYKPTFNINASLGASLTSNSIEEVSSVMPTGGLLRRPENIGKRQRYSANLSSSVRMLDNKMTLNINARGGFVNIDANNGSGMKNHGWEYSCFVNYRADTWKGGNAGFSAGIFGPDVSLQGTGNLFYFSSINVSQQLLDKAMRISLSVRDPWTSKMYFNSTMKDANFYQRSVYERNAMRVNLSVSWRFGSMSGGVKKASRSIENDDLSGGSKGGNQGGAGQ